MLAYICEQLWPNLAADALWTIPLWVWHHTKLKRELAELLRRIED